MRISAYEKERGNEVHLKRGTHFWPPPPFDPDLAYISCVFSWNAFRARMYAQSLHCPVKMGGYGVNGAKLPDEIEHIMPDYDLYGIDYSIGFTTRGCIRKCEFCIVPEMEGWIRDHAPISEFHDPRHDKVVLYDNNILALKWKFYEDLEYIKGHDLKVDFNQGLDCRLFDEDVAKALSDVKIGVKGFPIRFAFDVMEQEEPLRRAIDLTHEYITDNYRYIIVYVLFNFKDTPAEALYRAMRVRELGASPFAQLFTPLGWGSDEIYVSPNWREIGIKGTKNFGRYFDRAFLWRGVPWGDYVDKKRLEGFRGIEPTKPLETFGGWNP